MSSPAGGFGGAPGKKAVHVKWAGKTIALGTFPAAEADEKCARAKALTRAWRSTMRPKPSREWVMLELERLGVRVVSGRLGRKAGEEGEEEKKVGTPMSMGAAPSVDRGWAGSGDSDLNGLMGNRRGSIGLGSMMNDGRRGSLGSIGQMVGLEGSDTLGHQSLGGGFNLGDAQRRSSGLAGLGNLAGSSLGTMGMSVNPNQHYEMLKLHHMNLLNEIQETTLMMNLYQQQQLQQQQQQLQQQATVEGLVGDHQQQQLGMMHAQQNGLDANMFGASQLNQQQRTSLGLGNVSQMGAMAPNQMGPNMGFGSPQQQPQQQQQQQEPSPAPQVEEPKTAPSDVNQNDEQTEVEEHTPVKSEDTDAPPAPDAEEEAAPAQNEKDSLEQTGTKRPLDDDLENNGPEPKKTKTEHVPETSKVSEPTDDAVKEADTSIAEAVNDEAGSQQLTADEV